MPNHPTPGAFAWPAAMVVWGPGFTSALHHHHCVQLVMTMRAPLRVRGGAAEKWRTSGAVLVRPDAAHEIDAQDSLVVIGFFAAESWTTDRPGGFTDGELDALRRVVVLPVRPT